MPTSQLIQAPHPLPEGSSIINPLEEPGWDALLASHHSTQFFQTSAWARVLHHTYGHTPFYLCSRAGQDVSAALPLMEVSSRWTGQRGVCLPFTDYCSAVEAAPGAAAPLFERASELGRERGWKYLEVRGPVESWKGAEPSVTFYTHRIALGVPETDMFSCLESPVRRAIRKAEKLGLEVKIATSLESVLHYYRLHCDTRKRHGVPPQPWRFFAEIQRHVLHCGHGCVVTAWEQGACVAAAVYFQHGRQAIYKFGASDVRFQQSRPNNLVMWAAMRHYAGAGCEELHLGRTSLANEGLRRFKLGFGAVESRCDYTRYDFRKGRFVRDTDRAETWANRLFRLMPQRMLQWAGQILYPHLS